jgi:putative toxin-antitoxin system antitoxin component (TIGR02293 family)
MDEEAFCGRRQPYGLTEAAIWPNVKNMNVSVFEIAEQPIEQVVRKIRTGLPARAFAQVAEVLNLSKEALASKLGLAPRTINRQKSANQTLSAEESEKVLRAARIHNLAKNLFTTDEAVSQWLSTPAAPLHDVAPIDLLDTDVGAREVEGFILGLAHGNFQ